MAQRTSTRGGGSPARSSASRKGKSGDDILDMYDAIGVSSEAEGTKKGRKIGDVDVDEVMEKARTYVNEQLSKARDFYDEHPKAVLGGLAGLVLGAGALTAASIIRGRSKKKSASRSAAASSTKSRSASAKKSSASKSSSRGKSSAKKKGSTKSSR